MSHYEIPAQEPQRGCPAENYGVLKEICGKTVSFVDSLDETEREATCWGGLPGFPCLDPSVRVGVSAEETHMNREVVAHYQEGMTLEEQLEFERHDLGLSPDEPLPVAQPPGSTLIPPCELEIIEMGLGVPPVTGSTQCQYAEALGGIGGTFKCRADLQPDGTIAASAGNTIGGICLQKALLEGDPTELARFSEDPTAYGD